MNQPDAVLSFTVDDMTCGHCVSSIAKAVETAQPGSSFEADLVSKRVTVIGATDAAAVETAIRSQGYTPVRQDG